MHSNRIQCELQIKGISILCRFLAHVVELTLLSYIMFSYNVGKCKEFRALPKTDHMLSEVKIFPHCSNTVKQWANMVAKLQSKIGAFKYRF